MVTLSATLLDALGDFAVDVREGFENGAWAVTEGLTHHASFTDTNAPRASLSRAIIVREFRTAAERRGLTFRTGHGGAAELYEQSGDEFAVIRLRTAKETGGRIQVIANSGSTWGGLSDEGLWRERPYIFGCLIEAGSDTVRFFVAEVTGHTTAAVPHLEFGWIHWFQTPGPQAPVSFVPDGGDFLDGWDQPQQDNIRTSA